jgi:hypothetical protein
MKDLEDLAIREILGICAHAHRICVDRFGDIGRNSDREDRSLQQLLEDMAEKAKRQSQVVEEYERGLSDPAPDMKVDEMKRLIRKSFTSLSQSFGEGVLHRDIALFFAESLEEEASRFYRRIAELAPDWDARDFFLEMSERERLELRHLRDVVLQG